MAKVTAVCLSTTLQRTITFNKLTLQKVNRAEKFLIQASGKAINVARVLNQLEAGYSDIVCPVGEENEKQFMDLAEKDRLEIHKVIIPGYTRECWTLLDRQADKSSTTELVVDEPVIEADFSAKAQEIFTAVSVCMKTSQALILAGSCPKIWPKNMSAQICKIAYDAGKIVMADFRGNDLIETLKICTPQIIKINEEEFCQTFGYDFPLEQLQQCVCEESKKFGNIIITTRGKDTTFAAQNGTAFVELTEKVEPINTIGCGDSFSAGFLYEYLESGNVQNALRKGTWCAARNAEREGCGEIM